MVDFEALRITPKRKISDAEKQILTLRIERMKIERDKSLLILGSSIILFFAFIIVSILGLVNQLISRIQLNILVVVGLLALIIGIIPYIKFVFKEGKALEKTLEDLTN